MNEGADTKEGSVTNDDLAELRSLWKAPTRPSPLASITEKMKRTRRLHRWSRVFVWALSGLTATCAAVGWWRDRSSRSLVGLVGVLVILAITLAASHRFVRGVGSGVDLAAGAMLDRLETNVRGELRLGGFLRRFVLISTVVLEAIPAWMMRDRWGTRDFVVSASRSLALSAAVVAFVLVVTENAQRRARVALRSLEQTRRELGDDDDGGGAGEAEPTAPALPSPDARGLRLVEVLVFVFVWMCFGFALRPSAEVYLLTGVPLTVYFQLAVARRPLRELWVKADGAPEKSRVRGSRLIAATVLFALLPLVQLVRSIAQASLSLVGGLWLLSALVGALGAGYAVVRFRRRDLRALLSCLTFGGALGVAMMIAAVVVRHRAHPGPWPSVGGGFLTFAHSFGLFVPVCFVLEEVTFRGAFDAHLQRPGESRGGWSAALVSLLWGIWHLPLVLTAAVPVTLGSVAGLTLYLAAVHVPMGLILSRYYRRTGNLLVPGLTHSFIDAIRDALLS